MNPENEKEKGKGTVTLTNQERVLVHQVRELGEWIGFETRNKYEVLDAGKQPLAYAAEQQKGIFGFLLRQYLGHWRSFSVHFFTPQRALWLVAHHPFRWFFQRIEVRDANGIYLGAIQRRFSILTKRFDIENALDTRSLTVSSPFFSIWTFTFRHQGRAVGAVKKRWSGLLSEIFTDRDNFLVEFDDASLTQNERALITVAALFVDLLYFEKKR